MLGHRNRLCGRNAQLRQMRKRTMNGPGLGRIGSMADISAGICDIRAGSTGSTGGASQEELVGILLLVAAQVAARKQPPGVKKGSGAQSGAVTTEGRTDHCILRGGRGGKGADCEGQSIVLAAAVAGGAKASGAIGVTNGPEPSKQGPLEPGQHQSDHPTNHLAVEADASVGSDGTRAARVAVSQVVRWQKRRMQQSLYQGCAGGRQVT